jgi:hypothetical protein
LALRRDPRPRFPPFGQATAPAGFIVGYGLQFVGNASFELGMGEAVDVGIAFNVLLHYEKEEIDQYLDTMCRQLREGGYLLIGETQDFNKAAVVIDFEPWGSYRKLPVEIHAGRRTIEEDARQASEHIDGWFEENLYRKDDECFVRELESMLHATYNRSRLYRLPLSKRVELCRSVLRRTGYRQALVAVESIYSEITRPGFEHRLDPEEPIHFVPLQTYHFLAEQLSIVEGKNSIADNRVIRFAIQDLHGGARRALALIGFALGLEEDIYNRVQDLSDLKHAFSDIAVVTRKEI